MVVALKQSIRGASNPWGAVKDALANLTEVVNAGLGSTLSLTKGGSPTGVAGFLVPNITGNTAALRAYQATVTVLNGATTGKEGAIGMPAHFIPLVCLVHVTAAAVNAVTLDDVGDDADTDSYCDGIGAAVNATGFKGVFGCNGVRGGGPNGTQTSGATATADEVEVVLSGDPGGNTTMRLTFIGILAT